MANRRPENLVLPPVDAKTRLKHRTKIYSKPEGFSFTPRRRKSVVEVEQVPVESVVRFISKGPINDSFDSLTEFLNHLSRLLHVVTEKQNKDLNEAVIQKCLPFIVHEEPQVRTMAFRLVRYSIHRESQLQRLLLSQLDIILIRSLDLDEFEREREEAFKLIAKLLFLYRNSALKKFVKGGDSNFTLFPESALKAIMVIALDKLPRILDTVEDKKPDKLFLPALGILVDLAVEDPDLVLKCAGTEWIVRALVGPGGDNSNISSLVCKVLLKWMDTSELREKARIGLVIEQIFAPLIDLGFFHQKIQDPKKGDPPQVKVSQILESVSSVFLSIIRSWTGMLACAAVDERKELISSSPFKLLNFLGLGTAFNPAMIQIRDMVISICCEFVDMPYASKKFNDWSEALVFYAKMHLPDKYKTSLRDDFVVGEMEALQLSGILNPDVVDCLMSFRAVASYILISAGLPQAVARLIMARPDDPMSIKATLLLADVLRSGASFLPEERKLMLLSIPSLIQAASERTLLSARTANGIFPTHPLTFPNSDNAMILIHRLDQLNDVALNRLPLQSQLIQIELFVKGGESLFSGKYGDRERSWSSVDPDERFERLVTVEHDFFSKTSGKELDLNHLESIVVYLEAENSILMKKHKHNDKLHSFFSKIFTIVLPSNAKFAVDTVSFDGSIVKSLCRAIRLIVPLAKTEPHYGELIEKFLDQCKEQLDLEVLYKGTFSPKNILNNCSHFYFAVLSSIGSLPVGMQMIEEAGILQM
ncbi:hypothetical protein FO519_006221 [Halicephalobus sp. NKZ332]|nr:hypothetical protein FO519_006221 [Halicephalobus sp. NKZ332]